ncbi:MAG: Hsp20/alpha crystallin family protein [Gemmatimonadetes bacterium]|nr:Hsp20/alpha crystallin family protein [Gemmatimonadota bacterium]MBK7785062.1 Hsp20/alpha crystallin family protein [Gemmatimonadota bacterium]MBK7923394.1 Hsp20/alpha crystallin family protein [Gemmatimonadota bacterium]MBK9692348.1 Hsp20/alpha crystallin family protein [Gemmatimonadota bacterium]
MTIMIRRPSELRRLNQVLDAAFTGWPFTSDAGDLVTSAWVPPTDVFEDADGLKIVAELPGLTREDVKLTVEHQTLTLRGEKKQVAEEKSTRVHRYERSYGAFERSFTLPSTVDVTRVEATFDHGVLTVTLPKAEQAKPRTIEVKVG